MQVPLVNQICTGDSKIGILLNPAGIAVGMTPPRGTQQTTQKPASAPPRTCRTAPTVLLRVEDMLRTSLSAGRRRATLIRQAAPSPRAKAAIGWRGAVAVVWHTVWAAPMHGSP